MILSEVEENLNRKLIEYRRELHSYPELSNKEFNTTKRIKKWLLSENIPILDFPLKSGIIAEIPGLKKGPTIAIRADIDALPITEMTNFTYSSKNSGIMHACGHDFHTAAILGAAIILNKRRSELIGNVRIIFQPAEEIAQGAKNFCQLGILENIQSIFSFHNKPDLPVGTIGIKSGPLMASVDRFKISIAGVGGHAGMPKECVNPIYIGNKIISNLDSILVDDSTVISITRFSSGNTWNVIPDKAELEGTVRTFHNNIREYIRDSLKLIIKKIESSFNTKITFEWLSYSSVVNNSETFTTILKSTATKLGYQITDAIPNTGGEDFSFYLDKIPGFFVWIGVDGTKNWHSPSYNLNEDALFIAANYFANLSVNILNTLYK